MVDVSSIVIMNIQRELLLEWQLLAIESAVCSKTCSNVITFHTTKTTHMFLFFSIFLICFVCSSELNLHELMLSLHQPVAKKYY